MPPTDPGLAALPLELRIAVQRGYLRPVQAKLVAWRAAETGEGIAAVILALRFLSPRRLKRLEDHVRYRLMRRQDRRYALLARALLATPLLVAALAEQRERFAVHRQRRRLGQLLVARGLLSPAQDRWLIARLAVETWPRARTPLARGA